MPEQIPIRDLKVKHWHLPYNTDSIYFYLLVTNAIAYIFTLVLLDEYNRTIIEKRNFETLLNTQKRKNDSKSYNHKKDNSETDKSIMEIKNYNYNSKFIADLQSLIYNAEKSWLLLGYSDVNMN